MKSVLALSIAVAVAFVWPLQACADQAQECEDLVGRAVAMFNEQGKAATLKAINDDNGPFINGELYVFALSMENVMLAHPHEKMIRHMMMENTKDSNGKAIFQEFRDLAKQKGSGWIEYLWAKPGAEKPSPKRSYIMRVPGENIYVGAGYYLE